VSRELGAIHMATIAKIIAMIPIAFIFYLRATFMKPSTQLSGVGVLVPISHIKSQRQVVMSESMKSTASTACEENTR
jgi:hypothetical protein